MFKGTLHITSKLCNAFTVSRPIHDDECGKCCRGCNQEEGQELELELSELEMQDLEVPKLEKKLQKRIRWGRNHHPAAECFFC